MVQSEEWRKLTGVTRRKIAGKQFTTSTPQDVDAVVVSDDDEVVDGVEEDEAKMLDTFLVLGTAPRGGDERMEQRWRRASRPTSPKLCTTMSRR
jgi:alkanesulfonate monooxygenase SsuD/methylene tetrahydromethanopterin reductase-like flavin-dependent oxidoreductase (luciferase family)